MTKNSRFRPKSRDRGEATLKASPAPWKNKFLRPNWEDRPSDGSQWLYGTHAVLAALANPKRKVFEVLATRNALERLGDKAIDRDQFTLTDGDELGVLLPAGAVHQGIAARVNPLEPIGLDKALPEASGIALILDQVSDPQNIGAVFRSAAAFGVRAIIQQDRKAPPITGALAKAAVGAIERVPDVRVVNIAQTIVQLAQDGWMTVGLSGEADRDLADVLNSSPTVLVLGAEGKGLRQLVGERCDHLARIPISPDMESLNVSGATAIALYAAHLAQTRALKA
ncbi:23S rRNA (guanosine(2251)-2'-O)-methyltransferase RlmB [Candidatus Phycosocius spiralis]|uniref:23S rRNA (Guanosine(2251)-2'-O)-methyltransferase RlmB n=1 Tax=Candidatus Phycosocius spiralis TaxID=2815099 RepID=A0ABQ4PYN7_9PROT|nr:23S rRNA (guanosine(2251)-2'-O)-methyltransferase RlmB [Candidatus Phycosocius spiralis]GIU68128.1 23S rRNA (guanosine(2251)-2'-O)-methyltransferase RlmB [Candidatus Phycosocius spiralis]